MLEDIKKFIKPLLCSLALLYPTFTVWADPSDNYTSISDLQPIIETAFNAVFAAVGAVLVGVIAFGIWKSSLATGDPRGLEGAKQTWSYALYGFMVVVLFFAIFSIAQGLLGIDVMTPKGLLDKVFEAMNALVNRRNFD